MNAQIKPLDASYLLITRERTEKLELLNHLVSNLAHAVIICGPEGVGKTYLLKNFQDTNKGSWIFCCLKGNSQFKLEGILELLNESIAQAIPDFKSLSLANAFDRVSARNIQIILVIDDAGNLAPGLLGKLIDFAEKKLVLRVIFALTHSEIYLKNGTDPAIDECYQIDIPPLSEKQCGDFLEYLSTLLNPRIQFSSINEGMVAALYSETHGIPGKILAQLPAVDNSEKKDYSKLILTATVAALVVTALGVQWWTGKQKTDADKAAIAQNKKSPDKNALQATVKPSVSAQTAQDEPVAQPQAENPAVSTVTAKSAEIRNDVVDSSSQVTANPDLVDVEKGLQQPESTGLTEPASKAGANDDVQKVQENVNVEQAQTNTNNPEGEGERWLMKQPIENYTLQLMALSDEQAIIEVLQRHQDLGKNLKYLKTKTRNGRDRFVLLYGSFSSPEQVKNEAALLPKELKKYWLRRIGAIQGEIGSAMQMDLPE